MFEGAFPPHRTTGAKRGKGRRMMSVDECKVIKFIVGDFVALRQETLSL